MSTTSACTSVASAIASLSPRSSRARMGLLFGLRTSTHLGALPAQSRTGLGATGCFNSAQRGWWNQNSRVELLEKFDLRDKNEVVDRRCVGDEASGCDGISAILPFKTSFATGSADAPCHLATVRWKEPLASRSDSQRTSRASRTRNTRDNATRTGGQCPLSWRLLVKRESPVASDYPISMATRRSLCHGSATVETPGRCTVSKSHLKSKE